MNSLDRSKLGKIAFGWAVAGSAIGAILASGMTLSAQTLASHDTNAPVAFDAGSIELDDRRNQVVLSGGVTVNQAGLTLRSSRMLASYTDQGSLNVARITANGSVVVTRGNEQARGDVAVYDFGRQIITMAGNVSLRRANDTLNGDRLVIDLDRGVSSVDGRASGSSVPGQTGSNGRVTGVLNPSQD